MASGLLKLLRQKEYDSWAQKITIRDADDLDEDFLHYKLKLGSIKVIRQYRGHNSGDNYMYTWGSSQLAVYWGHDNRACAVQIGRGAKARAIVQEENWRVLAVALWT